MIFSKTEAEQSLDRAVELLVRPTLDNLRTVEELLRDAVVRMPRPASEEIGLKVRLCGRLLDHAEVARPGSEPPALYTAHGEQFRSRTVRVWETF